jgi:plastocyanin domain-containing protein
MYKISVVNLRLYGQRYFKYLSTIVIFISVFLQTEAGEERKPLVVPISQDGVQRVEILAGEYYFTPNYIILKVNAPTELKIKKESGLTPHDIVLKAPEAGMDIAEEISTESKTIKFTPSKIGKFPFYCSKKFLLFKSHRERGMEGMIEVTE